MMLCGLLIVTCVIFSEKVVASTPEFPLKEFYFGPLEGGMGTDLPSDLRQKTTCGPNFYARCCSCKEDCMRYKHCCIDFLWFKDRTTNNMTMQQYKQHLLNRTSSYKDVVCMNVSNTKQKQIRVLMVASCLANQTIDENGRNACEIAEDIQPVLGDDHYVYKNRFCARCNNVQDYRILNISIYCETYNESSVNKLDAASILAALDDCTYKIDETWVSDHINECSGFDLYRIPSQVDGALYKQSSDLCRAYAGQISSRGSVYRNVDCTNTPPGLNRTLGTTECHITKSTIPIRYSVIISFHGDTTVDFRELFGPTYAVTKSCGPGETFDILSGKCINFSCGSGYVRIGSECTFINITTTSDLNKEQILMRCSAAQASGLYVTIHAAHTATFNRSLLVDALIQSGIELDTSKQASAKQSDNSEVILLGQLHTANSINALLLYMKKTQTVFEQISSAIVSSVSRLVSTKDFGFEPERVFPNLKLCAKPRQIEIGEANISSQACSLQASAGSTLPSDYISIFNISYNSTHSTDIYVCDGFFMSSCSQTRVNVADYKILPDLTVYTASNSSFSYTDYSPTVDGITVCSRPEKAAWKQAVESAESYITIAGIAFSTIAYIWVIATYLYFRELNTIPGKNLVCLCTVLLISDILLLVQVGVVDSNDACKVLAALLHFFQLCTHTWAGIITYDITYTFLLRRSVKRNLRSKARFIAYTTVAISIPALIVVLCLVLSAAGVYIGYGKFNNTCWINSVLAKIFAYILPVLIIIILCIGALTVTVNRIQKRQAENAAVLHGTGGSIQSMWKMTLRLVALLGVIELVALTQVTNSSKEVIQILQAAFQILYAFLRSFRGVIIWIFYILLSSTVMALYRDLDMYKKAIMKRSTASSDTSL